MCKSYSKNYFFFYIPIIFLKKKNYQKIFFNNNDTRIHTNLEIINKFNSFINYQNDFFLKFKNLFTKKNNIIQNNKEILLFNTFNYYIKTKLNVKNINLILNNNLIKSTTFINLKKELNNNLYNYINQKQQNTN